MKLSIGKHSADMAKLATIEDLTTHKNMKQENDKKITALKENFKDCEQLYSVYSDIADTYYAISKGDYISRLVEEERKRRESMEQNRKKNKSL